jgi:hypothetical protein
MFTRRNHHMKRLTLILSLIALFAFPSIALADVAPPYNPPGSNLEPGSEGTQVRMASESVLIAVNSDTTPGSLGSARVTASFTMRNLGTSDESMAVRFPIAANDGRFQYPEITNVVIKVNGQQVSYRRASYPDARYQRGCSAIRYPGVRMSPSKWYTLNGSGYAPTLPFYYISKARAERYDGQRDVTLPPVSRQPAECHSIQIGWGDHAAVRSRGMKALAFSRTSNPGP